MNSYAILKFSKPNTFRILKTYKNFGLNNESSKALYIVHKPRNRPRQKFSFLYTTGCIIHLESQQ